MIGDDCEGDEWDEWPSEQWWVACAAASAVDAAALKKWWMKRYWVKV